MEINLSFSFFSVFVDADHPTLVPLLLLMTHHEKMQAKALSKT